MLFGSEAEQRGLPLTQHDIRHINKVYNGYRNRNWFNSMSMHNQIKFVLSAIYGSGAITPSLVSNTMSYITPERGTKRLREPNQSPNDQPKKKSLSNFPHTETMESESTDVAMLRSSTEAGQGKGKQETPITNASPSYQLQDTHTTILPVTFYFSAVLESNSALDFVFRGNTYVSPLVTLIGAAPNNTMGGIGAKFTKGLYNKKMKQPLSFSTNTANETVTTAAANFYGKGERPSSTRWTVSKHVFPEELAANAQPVCQMAAWWEKIYAYYAVLGCDYEIIINQLVGPAFIDSFNNDITVASGVDVYSNTKTQNQLGVNLRMSDVKYWKKMKWHYISAPTATNNGSKFYTIKGHYNRGDGKRLVTNDEDVQTWTNVNTTPNLKEDIHFMFWPSPFNNYHNQVISGKADDATTDELNQTAKTVFNAQVTLKYIVQFKDLNASYQFPKFGDTTINLSYPSDFTHSNQTPQ